MGACPDEETVFHFAEGLLPEGEIAALEEHVACCADCCDLVAAAARALSSEDTAAQSAIGSYRLIEAVGLGGAGGVYRAEHTGTGEPAAVKIVRVRARGAAASIQREIHALHRVRHPGVVRILEHGVAAGRPWYAMELIEGETLEQHLSAVAGASERGLAAIAPTLRILRELAGILAFVHGRGIVHRDLTPQNVLLREGGAPVLADFGLAQASTGGREAISLSGAAAGTVAYMAPEQIRGERADARADLYALGCILHRAVTGRHPFEGSSPAEILRKHLDEAPVRVSERAPWAPARLDALIAQLLAKDARDRVGYADDVEAALGEIAGDPRGIAGPRPRPYVYRPGFAGRDEWLRAIDELLARAASGVGGQVVLSGASGVGKTRLLAEIVGRARRRGLPVIAGACGTIGGDDGGAPRRGAALHAFRPLLRAVADACRGAGAPVIEGEDTAARAHRLLGARAKVLSAYEPELADLPGLEELADPPPLSAQAARARVLACVRETLDAFAQERPLVLALDDLESIDELSLGVIETLPPGFLERAGILLVAAHRSGSGGPRVERLSRAPGAVSVCLDRVSGPAVRAMASDMLGRPDVPEPLLDLVAAVSGGNPFLVTEYLRAAVEEGRLRRRVGAAWALADPADPAGSALPRSREELVGRRLAALPAPARHLMEIASVLGRDLDADLLLSVGGLGDAEGFEALDELVVRSLVDEGIDGELRVSHDALREIAYDGIAVDRRRALHAEAAAAIERRAGDGPDLPLYHPILAHHWARAGVAERAVHHLDRAGERALATAAYEEAARAFEGLLGLAGGARDEAGIRRVAGWERRLGEAWYGLGDLPRCEEHSLRALAAFGHPLPRSRAGWAAALAVEAAIQAEHVIRPGRDVEPRAERREVLKEASLAAARVAHRYLFADDSLAVVTASLHAVNRAERAAGAADVARPYAQLGYLAAAFHLPSLAARYFARSRAAAEGAGDPYELAVALYHDATAHLFDGRWDRVLALGRSALDTLATIESPQETEIVETILAHADYCAGRYAASIARCEAILASARARANAQHEAWGHYAGARSLLRLGRLDEAQRSLDRARALLDEQSDRASEIICDGLSAWCRLRRGDDAAAERLADATLDRAGSALPAVFSLGDGYAGAAEVHLDLWLRRGARAIPRAVRRAWAALGRFALVFAIGRPAFLLYWGRVEAHAGRDRAASALLRRARREAEALAMPYEEASASLALARIARGPPADRRDWLDSSRASFARLGCADRVAEIDAYAASAAWKEIR